MSIGADIHKRSNGAAVRREDTNWWMGITGITYVDHGQWADPELKCGKKILNYWEVMSIARNWCAAEFGSDYASDGELLRRFCKYDAPDRIKDLIKTYGRVD